MTSTAPNLEFPPGAEGAPGGGSPKEPWRTRWSSGNRGPGHLGYWNPNGVMRSDTVLPDGSQRWMYTRSPGGRFYRLRAVCFENGTVAEVMRFWWQD